jgi:putative transposase
MLTDRQFGAYCARLNLPQSAVDVIRRVRESQPARRGVSQHINLSGRFVSHKMGFTLGYSAKHTEGLGLLGYELDDDVLEFWEEPGIDLRFEFVNGAGQLRAGRFHPDTLVLEHDGAFIDEWKTEEQLLRDAERMPGRYVRDETGWRSPSAEASAARLGLDFRLRTPATLRPEVGLNGSFLRDYFADAEPVPAAAEAAILARVANEQGVTLDRVLADLPGISADDVFRLIVRGSLYVDLTRHRLADTFYVPVYTNAGVAAALDADQSRHAATALSVFVAFEPGQVLRWDDALWTVVAITNRQVTLRAASGALLPLDLGQAHELVASGGLRSTDDGAPHQLSDVLRAASPGALRKASSRYSALRRSWEGKTVEVKPRTLQRWQEAFRHAERTVGAGFAGLLEKATGRPAGPTLSAAIEDIVAREAAEFYDSPDAPNKRALYGRIRNVCVARGLEPPSYATVRRRLERRDAQQADERRRGRKAAYRTSESIWYLASDTPIHGERPWELAHIDHTELDVVLVDSETGVPLGRPWLTLMIDAYSRRILAYWLTFDPPSYRSLMMVIRGCVARWSRLPDRILVDGGAEFGSIYFEQLLAIFSVELTVRPGQPRFGAVIERFFGGANTRLIHALAGNTKPTKDVRSMSRDMDPARRAAWTLSSLRGLLDDFVFEVYDTIPHPALGTSPRHFYELRSAQTGLRDIRLIADDEAFLLATLPTTAKGTARVDRQKGVKINSLHYSAIELRAPGVPGTDVPIRYDPMDIRHAFAFVAGRWIECWCASLRRFPAISERYVTASLSSELLERGRAHSRSAPSSASEVAKLVSLAKSNEVLLRQLRADAESRAVFGAAAEWVPSIVDDPEAVADEAPTEWKLEVYESYV